MHKPVVAGRPIHTAASGQRAVGRVRHRVYGNARDVALHQPDPPSRRYFSRTRVPRIFWALSVFRKLGTSRSISSKYEESAGVFCAAL